MISKKEIPKKATAQAPANIAFIKYWGKKNEKLRLPANTSLSMNLSRLWTKTTVEFNRRYLKDEVIIDGQKLAQEEENRVIKHLERIRKLAGLKLKAKVVSQNNFPSAVGLASSASGFAALTLAACAAAGLKLKEKELSVLARLGSGSACRSIPDGFVEWVEGKDSQSSYAFSLYPFDYWQLKDIIVIIDTKRKKISSSEGHSLAQENSFYKTRLKNLPLRIKTLKKALGKKDFFLFGQLLEEEALEFQAICLTSKPTLLYWEPKSLEIIKKVWQWRQEGLAVYFTFDAGPTAHLICEAKNEKKILNKLKQIKGIWGISINQPAQGARLLSQHLF